MRMPKPPGSLRFNKIQRAAHNCLKQNTLKTDDFRRMPESALGAGAFAFISFVDSIIYKQPLLGLEGTLATVSNAIVRDKLDVPSAIAAGVPVITVSDILAPAKLYRRALSFANAGALRAPVHPECQACSRTGRVDVWSSF